MSQTTDASVRPRVLIVDDDEDDLRICRAVLEYHGYQVSEARDGREGIDAARAQMPDLVLMDIRMPGMDGWDATTALRSDPATAGMPIIAFTAETMQARPTHATGAVFDLLLSKPVRPSQILEAVQGFVGGSSTLAG